MPSTAYRYRKRQSRLRLAGVERARNDPEARSPNAAPLRVDARWPRLLQVAVMKSALLIGLMFATTACGGGIYGYTREYVAYGDEDDYLDDAVDLTYEEVRRNPGDFSGTLLGWFGTVTSIEVLSDGMIRAHLSFRTHRERHLCADELESSCRVTVAEREGGPFSAIINPRSSLDPIVAGSLLRVYGSPNGEENAGGGPILEGQWYRHWPRGTFRTSGDAAFMRR